MKTIEMKIKRFADSKSEPYTHWIEDENGNRTEATENQIYFIWNHWSFGDGNGYEVYRNDSDTHTIFEYSAPIDFNEIEKLNKKYNLKEYER